MGLRTASVRHPQEEVMAPALTETNQSTSSFKLPQNQFASPSIKGTNRISSPTNVFVTCNGKDNNGHKETNDLNVKNNDAFDPCSKFTIATNVLTTNVGKSLTAASDNDMNLSSPMGDQDKMGLQKTELEDVSDLLNNKTMLAADDASFGLQEAAESDITNNVEDLMQVIKSIESGPMFSSADLSLSGNCLDDELFKDVDVMNLSMGEEEIISNNSKELHTKELLSAVTSKQLKLERKMDHLMRTVRKFQVRHMGQHVSSEIAGVFEHVHRTLKRAKVSTAAATAANTNNSSAKNLEISGGSSTMSFDDNSVASCSSNNNYNNEVLEKFKPLSFNSTKSLLKKLEYNNTLMANSANCRRQQQPLSKSLTNNLLDPCGFRTPAGQTTSLPQWTQQEKDVLSNVAGNLEAEMRMVQGELDSEATESSSGGESCDENENYNNPHQQFLPIRKRAAWKYVVSRSSIASKWTWLQSQISDLEYRIRQHTELQRKIRASKETVKLQGSSPPRSSVPSSSPPNCLNGYRSQVTACTSPFKNGGESASSSSTNTSSSSPPSSSCSGTLTGGQVDDFQCARTRPLSHFGKRKLLQLTGLDIVSKRAARPSTVRCGCTPPEFSCALCTGRVDPTQPRDIPEYLSRNEVLSLLDSAYHPVFSMREDASASVQLEAIMKTTDWQQRSARTNLKSMKFGRGATAGAGVGGERPEKPSSTSSGPQLEHRPRKNEHRKKYNRLIKPSTANALSAKIKNRFHRGRKQSRLGGQVGRLKKRSRMSTGQCLGSDGGAEDEIDSLGLQKRSRIDSYDIDNIIIPYSVAALTRVEKLEYKEILTPKWRMVDQEGDVTSPEIEEDAEEDLSEETLVSRHEKCEQDERKKFLNYIKLPVSYGRPRASRRTDSRAESSGANTPDPMSPAPLPPAAHNAAAEHNNSHHHNATTDSSSLGGGGHDECSSSATTLLPSISALRRRTVSQNNKSVVCNKEEFRSSTPEVEVPPYDKRVFPLSDDLFDRLVRNLPEEQHHHRTKQRVKKRNSQHHNFMNASFSSHPTTVVEAAPQKCFVEEEKDFPHDSESTESAYGDEDPNDPEWDVAEENKELFCR